MAIRDFKVLVYERYGSYAVLDDLTTSLVSGSFSWSLHGGCDTARLTVVKPLDDLWVYLQGETPGRHYAHIVITEGLEWRWEGRITSMSLHGDRGGVRMSLTAMGYWSSCRDKEIPTDRAYTNRTVDYVVKDLLTNFCPSIATNHTGIATVSGASSPTIPAGDYFQDAVVRRLAPLGDDDGNQYYFSVGEGRLPRYSTRDLSEVHWLARLSDATSWSISQDVDNARNKVTASDGENRYSTITASKWPDAWPDRDITINVPSGVTESVANNASQRAAIERGRVQSSGARFVFGRGVTSTSGLRGGTRSAVRAGDVLRIIDLFPRTRPGVELDHLRTFYLGHTRYDMLRDDLTVEPDDPPSGLSSILARTKVELRR